jgi:hypothetical protein
MVSSEVWKAVVPVGMSRRVGRRDWGWRAASWAAVAGLEGSAKEEVFGEQEAQALAKWPWLMA